MRAKRVTLVYSSTHEEFGVYFDDALISRFRMDHNPRRLIDSVLWSVVAPLGHAPFIKNAKNDADVITQGEHGPLWPESLSELEVV